MFRSKYTSSNQNLPNNQTGNTKYAGTIVVNCYNAPIYTTHIHIQTFKSKYKYFHDFVKQNVCF